MEPSPSNPAGSVDVTVKWKTGRPAPFSFAPSVVMTYVSSWFNKEDPILTMTPSPWRFVRRTFLFTYNWPEFSSIRNRLFQLPPEILQVLSCCVIKSVRLLNDGASWPKSCSKNCRGWPIGVFTGLFSFNTMQSWNPGHFEEAYWTTGTSLTLSTWISTVVLVAREGIPLSVTVTSTENLFSLSKSSCASLATVVKYIWPVSLSSLKMEAASEGVLTFTPAALRPLNSCVS